MSINQVKIIVSLSKGPKTIMNLIKENKPKEFKGLTKILKKKKKLNKASTNKALRKHFSKDINSINKTIHILNTQAFIKNKQKSCGRNSKLRKSKEAIYELNYEGIFLYICEEFLLKENITQILDKATSIYLAKNTIVTLAMMKKSCKNRIFPLIKSFLNNIERMPKTKKKLFEIFIANNSNLYQQIINQRVYLKRTIKINKGLELFLQYCNTYIMKDFYLKQSDDYTDKIYKQLEDDDEFSII